MRLSRADEPSRLDMIPATVRNFLTDVDCQLQKQRVALVLLPEDSALAGAAADDGAARLPFAVEVRPCTDATDDKALRAASRAAAALPSVAAAAGRGADDAALLAAEAVRTGCGLPAGGGALTVLRPRFAGAGVGAAVAACRGAVSGTLPWALLLLRAPEAAATGTAVAAAGTAAAAA